MQSLIVAMYQKMWIHNHLHSHLTTFWDADIPTFKNTWSSVNAQIFEFTICHIYANAEIPVFTLGQIFVNAEVSALPNFHTSVIFVNAEISAKHLPSQIF